jgi:hypothetical protein
LRNSVTNDRPRQAEADNVHNLNYADPPEVQAFRALAASRRRGDRSQIRPLTAEMLRFGWVVYAVEPRQSGKAVRR